VSRFAPCCAVDASLPRGHDRPWAGAGPAREGGDKLSTHVPYLPSRVDPYADHPYVDGKLLERRARHRRWLAALAERWRLEGSWSVHLPDYDALQAASAERTLREWIDAAVLEVGLIESIDQIVEAHEAALAHRLVTESSIGDEYGQAAFNRHLDVVDSRAVETIQRASTIPHDVALNLISLTHTLKVADALTVVGTLGYG